MEYAIISLELIALLLIGFIFKWAYKSKIDNNTLKTLIVSFFLPILLFVSFSEVNDEDMHGWLFFFFGLLICIVYHIGLKILFAYRCHYPQEQKFLVHSTLATIAPGLTVYPFADRFLGRGSLSILSVMNLGIKLYIFTYIYFILSIIMKRLARKQHATAESHTMSYLILMAVINFFKEPVIIAIIVGLIFYLTQTSIFVLSPQAGKFLSTLGDFCTILIMLYIGLNLYKKYEASSIAIDFSILFFRSGLGLIFCALYCYVFNENGKIMLLYIALSQGAVSLWPFIIVDALSNQNKVSPPDQALALRVIAFSFPLTIVFMLIIFNLGPYFTVANTHSIQLYSAVSGFILMFLGLLFYPRTISSKLTTAHEKRD